MCSRFAQAPAAPAAPAAPVADMLDLLDMGAPVRVAAKLGAERETGDVFIFRPKKGSLPTLSLNFPSSVFHAILDSIFHAILHAMLHGTLCTKASIAIMTA